MLRRSFRRPEDGLYSLKSVLKVPLELGVDAACPDVFVNSRSDHLDDGFVVDGRDRLQRVGLVGGQSDGHGFRCSHTYYLDTLVGRLSRTTAV